MSPRRRSGDSDDSDDPGATGGSFADAMGDVKPLANRARVRPAAPPGREAPRPDAPVRFHHPDPEQPLLGISGGIDNASLRRLRSGGVSPDRDVDLHGLDRPAARREIQAALDEAWEAGERCLRIIHGRGARSAGAPVLRGALPEWLAEPPHGPTVLAFAPAPRELGGTGATLVLLRRKRQT